MKFTTLTRRFSRSEGGHNGTSRQDSVVPYSPVPYSLPVQGPGPALLPAHPALLEARQLALEKQQSIIKDREANTPSSQEIPLRKVSTQESSPKIPLTLDSISEYPTPRQSARFGLRSFSKEISDLDLCAALGTYLNYLPLVGDEEEQEEECQLPSEPETMESNMRNMKPPQENTTPVYGSAWFSQVPSTNSIEPGHGPSSTCEEILMGIGIEELHALQGKRSRNFPTPRGIGKEFPTTLETVMSTPPVPIRNPARLLRGHGPEKAVLAASYRWQRRQNKRQTLAAGSNARRRPGELLPKASGEKLAASQSRSNIHDNNGRDRVQIMNESSETRDEEFESHKRINDQTTGLGIRVEQQPSRHRGDNDKKQIGPNEGCSSDGDILPSAVPAGENGSQFHEASDDKSQSKNIGLGINVYGVCEPFRHGDEEDEQPQDQEVDPEDVNALVKVLRSAWKISPASRALEMGLFLLTQPANPTNDAGETAGVESTEAVEGPQLSTEVIETAADGSKEPELPVIPRLITGEGEYIEEVATHIVTAKNVVVDVGKVEATLALASSRDVVPMRAPLSVAARVAVPRKVAASSSSQPPTASLKTSRDLLDEIDDLLEVNYRGQAESFNKKISGASAARSFSTHSSAAATSLRAPTNSTAPTSNDNDTPSRLAGGLIHRFPGLRTPGTPNQILIHSFAVRHGIDTELQKAASAIKKGPPPPSPHVTYGHRFYTVVNDSQQLTVGDSRLQPTCIPEPVRCGIFYFSDTEREYIDQLVHSEPRGCEQHPNCIECYNTEYAYLENKIMPTTMPPEERNRIISNNRSLRNIKNELEALAETGAISDEQFDTIMSALPAESSLGGAGGARTAQASGPAPPTTALNSLNLGNSSSPPAYTSAPPSLPDRNNPPKPELTRATALYRYAEAGDCNFEVGDEIAVYEYMNADWWLGKNLRTGQEGVFPVNYVQAQTHRTPPGGHNAQVQNIYGNEKGNGYGGGYQPQQQYQAPPAGPSNPYNSPVPPMDMANGQPDDNKPNKGAEAGKKFGKKLGNAAIFGAGASIGSNIVNSIF